MNATANTPKTTVKRDGTVEVNGVKLGTVGRGWGGSYKAGMWEASFRTGRKIGSFATRAEAVEGLIQFYRERSPRTAAALLGEG